MKQQTILAGPVLRHTHTTEFTLWFVTTHPPQGSIKITSDKQLLAAHELTDSVLSSVRVGQHCYINLLHLQSDLALPEDQLLGYDLLLQTEHQQLQGLAVTAPQVCYPGYDTPIFSITSKVDRVLHGSCRKPHHPQTDALVEVDKILGDSVDQISERPDLLIFSGDQVYVDDVAGAMLDVIHQLIDYLGLYDESWSTGPVNSLKELRNADTCYYLRESLLPDNKSNEAVMDMFFQGKRKPIFTSVGAQNHLVALSEVLAMYLLVWSDVPWQFVELDTIRHRVPQKYQDKYQHDLAAIKEFKTTLASARRPMANMPVYMMFDDHDVTDDWNLTRGWEEAAYSNPFSRRIIGNALLGYFLCQGWGNQPNRYKELKEQVLPKFNQAGLTHHDQVVDEVLQWDKWHFVLATQPKIVVLDTRTHRWRSESSPGKPSGLMDWEALSELQNELIDQPAVIMVSPAPVFGVKLIEAIQRLFTYIGKPLMVDAENWMAHPGAANVLLNIFHHPKTPPNFIILSGDVHYSFAYDVTLRRRKNSPKILQVTASGIKNAFPDRLISWLDRLNLMLYGSNSPLNIFTKRRNMRIKRRKPDANRNNVLFNHSGIGELRIAERIEDTQVKIYASNGKVVEFK
jgi:hypothetical protein